MEVTPEMASDWLSFRNPTRENPNTSRRNRAMSPKVTAKYQRDMETGLWKLTRQGLSFDTEGWILDGQHRLKSLANSNLPFLLFWVYPDEPRDTFGAYDQNYKRSAAHVLGTSNASTSAAAARWLAALKDRNRWTAPRYGAITIPEIISTFQAWPELERHSRSVLNVRNATFITPAPHLAILAQAERTEYAHMIPDWIDGLVRGNLPNEDDPRLRLRNRFLTQHHLMGGGKNRDTVYALIAKSWNTWAEGKDMTVLRHTVNEPLPHIIGYGTTEEEGE